MPLLHSSRNQCVGKSKYVNTKWVFVLIFLQREAGGFVENGLITRS